MMTAFAPAFRPSYQTPLALAAFPVKAPEQAWIRDVILVAAASLILAGLSQISFSVPFSAEGRTGDLVPITGQTFGVLLIGVTLGSRRAAAGVLAYLAWGWAGAPFFAGGAHGMTVLYLGATAGYLWGFVLAAFVVGWMAEHGFQQGAGLVVAMLVGNVLIYLVGLPVLALWIDNAGLDLSVWYAGLWPFIPGDMAKLIAAALVVPVAWSAVRTFRPIDD